MLVTRGACVSEVIRYLYLYTKNLHYINSNLQINGLTVKEISEEAQELMRIIKTRDSYRFDSEFLTLSCLVACFQEPLCWNYDGNLYRLIFRSLLFTTRLQVMVSEAATTE